MQCSVCSEGILKRQFLCENVDIIFFNHLFCTFWSKFSIIKLKKTKNKNKNKNKKTKQKQKQKTNKKKNKKKQKQKQKTKTKQKNKTKQNKTKNKKTKTKEKWKTPPRLVSILACLTKNLFCSLSKIFTKK